MKSTRLNFSWNRAFIVAVLCVFALGTGGCASGVNMTGAWTLQVEAATGSGSPVFTLEQEGEKLSGTYAGKFGEAPVTGTVTGNDFKMMYEMNGLTVTYAGKVEGNTCKGDVDYGPYGTATFTGSK